MAMIYSVKNNLNKDFIIDIILFKKLFVYR